MVVLALNELSVTDRMFIRVLKHVVKLPISRAKQVTFVRRDGWKPRDSHGQISDQAGDDGKVRQRLKVSRCKYLMPALFHT